MIKSWEYTTHVYQHKDTLMYLHYEERTTHTGAHKTVEFVDDISQATKGLALPYQVRQDNNLKGKLQVVTVNVAGQECVTEAPTK